MRRSFVRLVAGGVGAGWAALILVCVAYMLLQSWTDERAKTDGVFLVHELLAQESPVGREPRLDQLREHFSVEMALLPAEHVG